MKQSSLLGRFVSYKENGALWIRYLERVWLGPRARRLAWKKLKDEQRSSLLPLAVRDEEKSFKMATSEPTEELRQQRRQHRRQGDADVQVSML
jgi:hypothetical protein